MDPNHNSTPPAAVRRESVTFHVILFLIGFAAVMPWSIVVSTADFWRVQLRDTAFEHTFELYFLTTFATFNCVGCAFGTFWLPRCGKKKHPQVRSLVYPMDRNGFYC